MANDYSKEQCISLGPWGGPGEKKWSYKFNGGLSIIIRHGECIDSVTFTSGDYSQNFGGNGGDRTDKVNIDWPKEYLISISGTVGNWRIFGPVAIRSLCFYTNLTKYGPFGREFGSAFSIPIRCGMVVGFHGLADRYLEAIGVHVIPISLFFKPSQEFMEKEQVELSKAWVSRCPGPWGGPGGKPWDIGVFTSIRKILIRQGNGILGAIQFEYEKSDANTFRSRWFGDLGIGSINQITFDFPTEYLVSVSGFLGPVDGKETVNSLTFYTTKGKYGPFGNEVGIYFASPTGGKIVGFFGRSGANLDAIGVHVEYF